MLVLFFEVFVVGVSVFSVSRLLEGQRQYTRTMVTVPMSCRLIGPGHSIGVRSARQDR